MFSDHSEKQKWCGLTTVFSWLRAHPCLQGGVFEDNKVEVGKWYGLTTHFQLILNITKLMGCHCYSLLSIASFFFLWVQGNEIGKNFSFLLEMKSMWAEPVEVQEGKPKNALLVRFFCILQLIRNDPTGNKKAVCSGTSNCHWDEVGPKWWILSSFQFFCDNGPGGRGFS